MDDDDACDADRIGVSGRVISSLGIFKYFLALNHDDQRIFSVVQ